MDISKIAGKNTAVTYNEKGHGQSDIKTRFDLVDGKAMFAMAAVLHEGAVKYGANNWRGISIEDHLNHLIMHAYAYLAGDRSDEHLSHIMCRAMFAQAVELQTPVNNDDLNVDDPTYHYTEFSSNSHPSAIDKDKLSEEVKDLVNKIQEEEKNRDPVLDAYLAGKNSDTHNSNATKYVIDPDMK